MELRLQPKPEIEIKPADKGIVSRKEYFAKKKFEEINQYFFPGHLIRNWKPKAELIYPSVPDENIIQYELDFNRDVQSCFVEDYAEEVYLRSPPPCFVVFGKFGTNLVKLSQNIAEEYGSVLIQVDDIVNQVIKTESETSKLLDKILRLGFSLTLNFILALLSFVAHTPEARHRGYVLCGLPSLPQGYDLSVEDQFKYLFTWDNKPTVFINVLFEDEDLVKTRSSLRYELENVGNEKCFVLHSLYNETCEDGEEETEDELLPIKDKTQPMEPDIDISPSRPWVQLPRDSEFQIWSELELYDIHIKPLIDIISARVDPQYFITVDSRVKNEFKLIQARMNLLQLWKSPLPVPFIPIRDEQLSDDVEGLEDMEIEGEGSFQKNEEDIELRNIVSEPPQTAFLKLFSKNTISPKYRWELSHYNYICPVSLREGEIVEGKSEFAVIFLKYIYFLRSAEAMRKFLINPRPYVLPIRPKPLTRFIIIGYPYSGKTSLAKHLSHEFSIPLIDLSTILQNDLIRKKTIYQEFCRQKAESREMIRLTAHAWQDWRIEEEQRINLIEEWIQYIQSLLMRRIEQFYSLKTDSDSTVKETQVNLYSFEGSQASLIGPESDNIITDLHKSENEEEALKLRGTPIRMRPSKIYHREYVPPDDQPTPSERIIQAMKNKDYDFHKNGLEVEANLFFSSLWNTFSQKEGVQSSISDEEEIRSLPGEEAFYIVRESADNNTVVDWVSLLPPQSLSSLLLQKKPYSTRERRKSFQIFLTAASKVYWAPSPLKTEFVKWRLPCFMDIPLCEIFLDNPLLLLKYCPEWLKERPLIPDPIDLSHPAIIEAGRKAYKRASIVTIKQSKEEVGILLRDAIEKSEREGMRISGEVISPGGWVVDNMVLDQEVWAVLVREKVYANHIYFMIDEEPECRRIINTWNDLHPQSQSSTKRFLEINLDAERKEEKNNLDPEKEYSSKHSTTSDGISSFVNTIVNLLIESSEIVAEGVKELDEIFKIIASDIKNKKHYVPSFSVDPFSQGILNNSADTWKDLKDDSLNEEATLAVQSFMESSSDFFSCRQVSISTVNLPLGAELQSITSKIINIIKPPPKKEEKVVLSKSTEDELNFFVSLILLPHRLEAIKEWLNSINRGDTITEIIVTNRIPENIHTEVVNTLNLPFIKKPRELEPFEVEEIKKEIELDKVNMGTEKNEEKEEQENEDENKEMEKYDREDIRIYGESGPFCIVNLERNLLFKGNPDFSLRYYGKLYFFWDQEDKNKFIEDPEKYAPYYSVIRSLPPVRVFVIGPIGCSKSLLSISISNQIGIRYVNFIKLLNKKLLPHLMPGCQKFTALIDKKLLLSDSHNKEAQELKEKFMNAPFEKRQYWLENTPYFSNLYEDQKRIHEGLTALNIPPTPKDFPKLTYTNIDSWPITLDEKESEKSQTDNFKESVFISMNDIEEIIKKYLKASGDLGHYCMNNSLGALYTTLPYLQQGYVLSDFPMRLPDVKYIIEKKWIPDLIIEITLSETEVLDKNIDNQMEQWENKLKQEVIEERLLEDTLNSIQRTFKMVRSMELLKEKRAAAYKSIESVEPTEITTKEMTKSQDKIGQKKPSGRIPTQGILGVSVGSGRNLDRDYFELPAEIDMEIEEEVDKIINEEFPPLSFNPIFESYDSGKERIIADITENYQRDVKEIKSIKEALKEINIPWIKIDSVDNTQEITNEIFIKLNALKKRIGQRGEFSFTLKMPTAEKLLQQGYYFLSKFGKWCPVQVYRMKNPIHMFRPLKARGKIIPIAYRNYIYFVGGENEKTKFISDPVKYVLNEPHHPNIPLRIAIIGPPKSGKSVLSQRLGYMFDLKIITMGGAIRFVLEKMPGTSLQISIDSYLKRGCFLPLSLKIEALLASLNDPQCVTQGFVFDGVPFDAAMTQSLAEEGKLPFVILSLIGEPYWGKINRENLNLKTFRLPYKQRVNLDTRYKEWMETYKRFVQWNQDTYNNLYEMNAKSSVTDLFYWAYDIIKKSFFAILYYVEYCVTDRALPLQYLCVSQHEYELRKSAFHNNCPVCWGELGRLRSISDPPPRSGLVQYLHHFYWICSEHMEKFLKKPKMYFPPYTQVYPNDLPKVISRDMFEVVSQQLVTHGFGRCPVTRIDFPSSLDWEGSQDYAVIYRDEIYLCKNQEMLDRFLARPWRYCTADTTFECQRIAKSKAVEELSPPIITSLPPVGFLEQTVANLIHDSLQVIGSVRPIYPELTPACTGCIFIGLYLKVNNPKKRKISLDIECLNYMTFFCKAYRFTVTPYRGRREEGQGDIEFDKYDFTDSESSLEEETPRESELLGAERPSEDSGWVDFENQADKIMWSAKYQSQELMKMKLVEEEELLEVPETPNIQVILRYQTYSLRVNPIPPVSNCLTFIYTRKPNMKLPEKFNYNTLYQPLPLFSSPYTQSMLYNPDKEFSVQLHIESKAPDESTSNLWKDKRAISDIPSDDLKTDSMVNMDVDMQYMIDRFIPRFQLLDVLSSVNPPSVPKVIDVKPIFFNPHRDYTYTLLLSKFFQTSHVLKCYEWSESYQYLEHSNIIDRNLGLCNVPSRLIHVPKKTSSAISRKSLDSYMEAFETANSFFIHKGIDDSRRDSRSSIIDRTSLVNYMQIIILEKLNEIIIKVSDSGLSYDSYEVNITTSETEANKPVIVLREVLPYPPLSWDIISHPYFAYRAVPTIFEAPHLDQIAHERHFSLLDGIIEPNDNFRFVRYPSWVHKKQESPLEHTQVRSSSNTCNQTSVSTSLKKYFIFDFFNLEWTAFLPYPFSWAYNLDVVDNLQNILKDEESILS